MGSFIPPATTRAGTPQARRPDLWLAQVVRFGVSMIAVNPTFNEAVRREYFKLPHDLEVLSRSFGVVLSPELQRDAAVLTFAIECADRLLDAIPEADGRARFGADVLACLRGEERASEWLSPDLAGWVTRLKEVAERHRVHEPFCTIARQLFHNSEEMRTAREHEHFIGCVVREGRLMVELLLLILAEVSTPAFESFMRELAGPANLGDKLRDARRDFARGEMALRPTVRFHVRLAFELCRRTLRLARVSLVNHRLLAWGLRSLFFEVVWFPFSKAHSHPG